MVPTEQTSGLSPMCLSIRCHRPNYSTLAPHSDRKQRNPSGPRREIMSANSQIEWTDATWNPVRGCTKISPGCKHCYAETFAERFRGVPGHPYEQGFDLQLVGHLRWT